MSASATHTASHRAAVAIAALLGIGGVLLALASGGGIGWLLAGFLLLAARFVFAPRPRELALVGACLAAFALFVALFVAAVLAILESGEVVVLRHPDERAGQIEDRLWVVDLEGQPSVTTGSDTARVERIRAHPYVELLRDGRIECRRAVVRTASSATPEERVTAERLFREKYGAGWTRVARSGHSSEAAAPSRS